jgi:peptide/nickel transport system substrate-binding protein/glutathione transport system substrate-binding protein
MVKSVNRRFVLKGAALAGGALMLPRGARAEAAPRQGGVLRWAVANNPGTLDPMTGRTASDFNALYALYDGLIDFDPVSLALKPGLAKSWTFSAPTILVLDLEEGVLFHDGTPFDAEAAKFNLDRYRTDPRSNAKADIATVISVETIGKYQVALHLDRPNAALPAILTDRVGMMLSPTFIKAKGPNVDRTPVGTGPWKLVSWQDNDRLILTRHEKYWKPGLPHLDGLNIAIFNEPSTALRSVIAGENDLVTGLGPQQKPMADRAGTLVTQLNRSMGMVGIYINYGRPPLDDVRIRQALCYGINRDDLNRAIALGLDETGSAVLPKEHWACDPSTADYYTYDPDKARKLLADAGFPNGLDIPMVGWSDQLSMQRQEVMMAQLAKVGVRVKLTTYAPTESAAMFFGPAKKGAARMALIAARPDPSQEYDNLFGKDGYFNAGGVELPGFRALLDATMAATGQAARKAAFAKLQRFEIENALMVTLLFNTSVSVASPKVKNFVFGSIDKPKLTEVSLEA